MLFRQHSIILLKPLVREPVCTIILYTCPEFRLSSWLFTCWMALFLVHDRTMTSPHILSERTANTSAKQRV